MEKIPTMIVVAVALVDASGRVLLQQRPKGKALAGLWEFPGGKVELGEVPEAALVRELQEELGVNLLPHDLSPAAFASERVGEKHMVLLLYVARQWLGVPQPLEADGLKWVHPSDMAALDMPPADGPLIPLLAASL